MKKIFLLATTVFCFANFINAQAGRLDPSFGSHGIVTADLGKNYSYPLSATLVTHLLSQSDGSMYVLESETKYLSKRRPDGSRDVSYGIRGYSANAGFYIDGAAIQSDGKIVVVGTVNPGDFALARFNADGSLDSNFSGDGKQTTDFNKSYDYAQFVTIQKDQKILVAGSSGGYLSFARYNTDGTPDNTFGSDGIQKSNLYYSSGKMAVQSNGKILVSVYINANNKKILRFNTDGSLDKTFTGIDITAFYTIYSIAVQDNGKIVFSGALDYDEFKRFLCRYNADGSADTSFSGDGKQSIKTGSGLGVQKTGKIVMISTGSVYRYNIDGSVDSTFGKNGKQSAGDFYLKTVAIQPDGKILAGGGGLRRYTADGKPDNTFDGDGKLDDFRLHAGNTIFKKTAIQKDGKVLAAGRTWNGSNFDFVIARYNTDGSPDNTFGNFGILTTGITFNFQYDFQNSNYSIAVQNNGKIVAAADSTLVRFNTDGSADNTFSSDGKLIATYYISAIAIQNDNKIVVSANASIIRYNTDGTIDKTFGVNGKQTIKQPDPGSEGGINFTSIRIQNDGKIVLAGNTHDVTVARLNTDGSLDNTFSNNGMTRVGGLTQGFSILIQSDEKIVIGYDMPNASGSSINLSRLNADGSADTSFHAKRKGLYIYLEEFFSMALEENGKILIGASSYLSRFNTDGSTDNTFNIDDLQALSFDINDIAISNNKLYAVGSVQNPGNVGLIARYLLDNTNTPPTVTLTSPADNTVRLAPAAHIKLSAAASDADGTITKVEFYNGNKLLHTETVAPYGYVWRNVGLGNYTITAKAYDNSGNVTTSAPVHISVVPNKPPVVSITKPVNNQSFAAPGYIHLEAAASDTDGRITNVKFYNGITLLRTEYEYPYTYHWENIPVGTYTITAVATDNWGAHTTSAPVTIRIKSAGTMIVSNKAVDNKTGISEAISLQLSPNPATSVVNLYTKGLQPNKPADISIISVSGIVLKKVQSSSAAQMQVDVSSLAKGVYTIKIVSGDKVMYKQFVKL